jgi:O-antigen/teichoic acid export membrane protein
MPTLKQKTVSGLTWSFIDNFSNQGISFIVGIVLARILSPAEFGLIGMITIFIAISQSLIDSGFSQALIRKKDCTETDYSTTFYFNVFVAFFLYFLLFALSKSISIFYHEPKLTDLIRVLGLVLLINSFSLIQRTILVKQINFKLLTKISIISSVLSGFIGIFLAFKGYGVWSLVVKTIVQQLAISVLLWIWNHWRPSILFSYKILKNLFGFGSKLMAAGLINTIYQNIYYLVIGKFFSATQLGYYTRADQFNSLPSANITGVIQRVSYPVLTELQDEPEKLKAGYKKLIISTTFITFSALIGMASMAQPMILTLIGEKWLPVVQLLQILCFAAMLFPLHSLNLNLLLVKRRLIYI